MANTSCNTPLTRIRRRIAAGCFAVVMVSAPLAALGGGVDVETVTLAGKSWDGAELPRYPDGQPEVSLLKYTIAPGTTLDWHKHNVINVGYVLSGSLKVVAENGDTLSLSAGDSLVELVGTWHRGINEGEEPVEILVFYAGADGVDNTVQKQ